MCFSDNLLLVRLARGLRGSMLRMVVVEHKCQRCSPRSDPTMMSVLSFYDNVESEGTVDSKNDSWKKPSAKTFVLCEYSQE